ncbi:hypothetical protein ACHAWF_001337 [Thalassiosira exigua]
MAVIFCYHTTGKRPWASLNFASRLRRPFGSPPSIFSLRFQSACDDRVGKVGSQARHDHRSRDERAVSGGCGIFCGANLTPGWLAWRGRRLQWPHKFAMVPHRLTAGAAKVLSVSQRRSCPRIINRCERFGHDDASPATSWSALGGIACIGLFAQTSTSSRCSMEASASRGARRRHPPIFGASVPRMIARGFTTSNETNVNSNRDAFDVINREDCPLCKKFGSGPCGETFKRWLACTDDHPGKGADGEPLHLRRCSDLAEELAGCLDANAHHYDEGDADADEHMRDLDRDGKSRELEDAWRTFVREVERGITSGKHCAPKPFPEDVKPKVEVRLATRTGAAFFVSHKEGRPIIAAYILDDDGNVIAAGSKDDMDMGDLGCVLRFKVSEGMNSAAVYALYDTDERAIDVAIFTRTTLLPLDKYK